MAEGRKRRAALALGAWASAGALVGLVNWLLEFTQNAYARSFLLALLALWSLAGLAAGLAAMAIRALRRRLRGGSGPERPAPPGRWLSTLRRVWAVGAGVGLALLAAYIGSAPRFAGLISREPRNLDAETAGPPNIILISLDTTRPDHLSAYGYHRPVSPALDALASRGTLFTDAAAPSSWTIPSHASFLTGMYPSHLGAGLGFHGKKTWANVPDSARTAAEILNASGYYTAGFVAAPTLRSFFGFGQGFDRYDEGRPIALSARSNQIFLARRVRNLLGIPPHRFLRFLDPPFRALSNFLHDTAYRGASDLHAEFHHGDVRFSSDADELNHKIFRWLDRRPPRPYFLFVNYFDPHDPYEAHDPPALLVDPDDDPADGFIVQNGILEAALRQGELPGPERLEGMARMYDAEIAVMDRNLGRLLYRLEEEHDMEHTVLAVVSDHGEAFGDHGLLHHGHHLYQHDIHQVLLLAGAGVPRGLTVGQPVSGVDVLPTLLDLAGVNVTGHFEGRSLRPLLEGEELAPRPRFAEVYGGRRSFPDWKAFLSSWISVEMDGLKLIRGIPGGEALFDLRSDPGELTDLSASRPEDVERLRRELDEYLSLTAGSSEDDHEAVPEDLLETLRGLGYIE